MHETDGSESMEGEVLFLSLKIIHEMASNKTGGSCDQGFRGHSLLCFASF